MTETKSSEFPPGNKDQAVSLLDTPILPDLTVTPENIQVVASALAINEALPNLITNEPTALLLDINNLYRRAAQNNFRIDYGKLKSLFEKRCDLRFCGAFSAVDRTNREAENWVKYMQGQDYVVVAKDLMRYTNDQGVLVSKGNMDIEIAIAALSLSPAFAHIVIGTCDGDFVPLIDKLREGHFRKVSVLGITNTDWSGMSDTLVRSADNFYDMAAIKDHISYSNTHHAR